MLSLLRRRKCLCCLRLGEHCGCLIALPEPLALGCLHGGQVLTSRFPSLGGGCPHQGSDTGEVMLEVGLLDNNMSKSSGPVFCDEGPGCIVVTWTASAGGISACCD